MRQVGYLAAAGIYALDNNIERLSEDHRRAKEIASIKKVKLGCFSRTCKTNILIFSLTPNVTKRI
jgi:threonine aldolase